MAVLVSIPFSALVLQPFAGLSDQARFLVQIDALAVVPFMFAAGAAHKHGDLDRLTDR
jgi:hypothetical protein